MTKTTVSPLVDSTDKGLIEFPRTCPAWCDRDEHIEYVKENDGVLTAADAVSHRAHGGDAFLWELRTVRGGIARDGGSGWTLDVGQQMLEPGSAYTGYAHEPLIELGARHATLSESATISMTTGEVRVLAAHMLALCDRVDLAR